MGSEWNRSGGGPIPKPLGGEMQKEHQAELQELGQHEHQAHEASKGKRRWWQFWRRDAG
jgi:hypothetical protein